MKMSRTTQTLKVVLLLTLFMFGLACGYSKKTSYMPAINQLVPPSVTAGSAAFTLEVDGTNFASNAVINFNGVAETTMVVSSTKLQATIPATAVMNAGTVPVTVTDPGTSGSYGGGTMAQTSAPMNFTINQ